MLVALFCLLAVLALSFATPPPPVTTLDQGQLMGRWFVTREGRTVAGFLGVPFAEPPLGRLRFKSPLPGRPWKGVYNATVDSPSCTQLLTPPLDPTRPSGDISEDCLYLNVYTPSLKPRVKLPVLVFFFGGSFERGLISSSTYGPDYLLDEDVLLVNVNFRLGILGFLPLEHPVLPGNLGLKDQRLALRWVKTNIARFGGDPSKVTLFGQSAGGASVHYHMLFNSKEGLFRAGIADSGSALNMWAFTRPGAQRSLVDKLSHLTQCPKDPVAMVDCLGQMSARQILYAQEKLKETTLEVAVKDPLFSPTIEPDCVADAFITTNPWNVTIHYPLLLGINGMEGLVYSIDYEADKTDTRFMELNKHYRTVLPYKLNLDCSAKHPQEVAESMKKFYFGENKIDRKHSIDLTIMFSDAAINYAIVILARKNSGKSYFYQFNYEGSNTNTHFFVGDRYYGVTHGDELYLLFPMGGPAVRNITERDTIVSKQMVKLWTNFAKHQDPTPTGHPTRWTPVETPSIEFLNIGQHSYTMERNLLKRRMDFWGSLPFRNKRQSGRPGC